MKMSTRSFRECDIRGKYPEEINEEIFFAIGNLIGSRWKAIGPVVVARDVRNGSRSLLLALVDGIVRAGGHVIDLGCVPTPVAYFARRHFDAPVGAIVTASHNPQEYNGLKLLTAEGSANREDILWLRNALSETTRTETGGSCQSTRIWEQYVKALEGFWREWIERESEMNIPRVVIDAGGGAWSKIAGCILKRFNIACTTLHDEPDSAFSARSPDCACPASLTALSRAVRECRADVGLAWDGDGDRLAVVDNQGKTLSADQVGLIMVANMPLKGERILVDVKVSRKVNAVVERLGGIPISERSAHCALERTMIKQNCLFGCEYSGHYFFRDLHGADDGLYSALRFASILGHQTMHSLLEQLPKFHITPDVRLKIMPNEFPGLQMAIIRSGLFANAQVSHLDGLRLYFPEGWFLLRPSVSEDKLSFRAEGETPEDLVRILRLFLSALPSQYQHVKPALEPWITRAQIER